MGKQNNIQKELRNSQAPLADQYSWENMESGIFSKLDHIDNNLADDKQPSKRLLYILLLCLIPILGLGGYYLGRSHSDTVNASKTITQQSESMNHEQQIDNRQGNTNTQKTNTLNTSNNALETGKQLKTKIASPVTNSTILPVHTFAEKLTEKRTETASDTDIGIAIKQVSTQSLSTIRIPSNEVNHSLNHHTLSKASSANSQQMLLQSVATTGNKSADLMLSPLDKIGIAYVGYAYSFNKDRMVNRLISDNLDEQVSIERQPYRLILAIGSNVYSHNYSGNDLATARNHADSYILGQSASLTLDIPLTSKWTVNTGIGFDRSVTKLDYSGVQDTMLTAEVMTHNLNNASGVTTTTVQNQVVAGTFLTDVELYNNSMSLAIPVSLRRNMSFSNYTLGIGAGFEYNYRYAISGRYLTEPTAVSTDYQLTSHNDQDTYQPHLLNGLVSANLDYNIGNGFGIGLGIDATYNINNAIDDIDINSNPIRMRGNLRLFRTF